MVTYRAARTPRTGPARRARGVGGRVLATASTVALVLSLAGCHQESPPSKHGEPAGFTPTAPSAYTPTVGPSVLTTTVESGGQRRLLGDYRGRTLYVSTGPVNAESPLCTGTCTSVWHPVLVRTAKLTDTGSLGVRVTTLQRPGGLYQLAVNGHRAYTFVDDGRPGQFKGDMFITGGAGGRTFTWRPVRVSKDAPSRVALKPG